MISESRALNTKEGQANDGHRPRHETVSRSTAREDRSSDFEAAATGRRTSRLRIRGRGRGAQTGAEARAREFASSIAPVPRPFGMLAAHESRQWRNW